MAKVGDIVKSALVKAGICDAREAPEAEDMQQVLNILNAMLMRWEADGLAIGWNSTRNTEDEMPTSPEAELAIIDNLAVKIITAYRMALTGELKQEADEGKNALYGDMVVQSPYRYRRYGHHYNILTDTYD